MVRRTKLGNKGKQARTPFSTGWKPPVREYPPLPTLDSPLADKVAAIEMYSGPYLVPGHAAQAATAHYGVPYTRFVQAVALLVEDPELIAAKPREIRLMRAQMSRRSDARRAARARTGDDPLRLARKSR